MKKLMIAAAMAACATVGFAETDNAITSANVVGYTTRDMTKDVFRLLGIPFQTTASTYYLNDIMPYTSSVSIDWTKTAAERNVFKDLAPQVQIQITSGTSEGNYEIYYYVQNARYKDENNQVAYKPGWCQGSGAYADSANSAKLPGLLTPGASVWFKDIDNEDPSIQTSGQVINEDIEITCPAGFRLRAPVFPKAFSLNGTDVEYTGLAEVTIDWTKTAAERNVFKDLAPQVQIQVTSGTNEGNYEIYYYVQNARYKDENNQVAYKPGWCQGSGAFADTANSPKLPGIVPVNGAFWAKGVSQAFTIKYIAQ